MICPTCNAILQIGDWPWCPHGRGTYAAIADDIPGGLTIENLGPEPVTVYSHSQRRRIMKARGLREAVRHIDGSPHTQSWSAGCSTTLDNGRILVSRTGGAGGEYADAGDPVVEVETLTLTVRELDTGFRVRPNGEPYGGENS